MIGTVLYSLVVLVSGGNGDMRGNANPVFCDVDTNYTTVYSNFSHLIEAIMPCDVTCNCCRVTMFCIQLLMFQAMNLTMNDIVDAATHDIVDAATP
jgi:hypothetical protein